MSVMTQLIIGGSGFLGFKLAQLLLSQKNEVAVTFSKNKPKIDGCKTYEIDITNKNNLKEVFQKTKPKTVFHLSALTNVDQCEKEKELALQINFTGSSNVLDECKKSGAKLVFVSTSAVFSGKKTFYEKSDYCPANYYGVTKMLAEKKIISEAGSFVIARTDHPYGWTKPWQKDNSVTRNIKKAINGEEIKEVVDWYNTPTFAENFVNAISEISEKGFEGIFHLTGADFLNRYEFALKTAEAFGFEKSKIKKIDSSELNVVAKRQNCLLDNGKTQGKIRTRLLGVKDGLKKMTEQKGFSDDTPWRV